MVKDAAFSTLPLGVPGVEARVTHYDVHAFTKHATRVSHYDVHACTNHAVRVDHYDVHAYTNHAV